MFNEENFDILEDFKINCPWAVNMIITWRQVNYMELIVELSDGTAILYDGILKTFRRARSIDRLIDSLHPKDEVGWRREFSLRLWRLMADRGMTQRNLADISGLSQASIAQYLNCNVMPSAFNVTRIADALDCTRKEILHLMCLD